MEHSRSVVEARSKGLFLCRDCGRHLAKAEFGERRDSVCMSCANQRTIDRSNDQMQEQALEMMDILAVRSSEPIAISASELCKRIVVSFGSLELFVLSWKQRLERHIEEKGVTGVVLNHYSSIFRLIAETSKQEHQQQVDKMTLDQIRDEQRSMLVKMLMEHSQGVLKDEAISSILSNLGLIEKSPPIEVAAEPVPRLSQSEVDEI